MGKKQKTENRYLLEVSEEQLMLISRCVEDCSRFASGQMEMSNTLMDIWCENSIEAGKALNEVKKFVTPELSMGESYGWSGGTCKNEHQRVFIAKTYAIYREILHRVNVDRYKDTDGYNVYLSPTLTCDEGGELPKVTKIKNDKNK